MVHPVPIHTIKSKTKFAFPCLYYNTSTFQLSQTDAEHAATSLTLIVQIKWVQVFLKWYSISLNLNGRQSCQLSNFFYIQIEHCTTHVHWYGCRKSFESCSFDVLGCTRMYSTFLETSQFIFWTIKVKGIAASVWGSWKVLICLIKLKMRSLYCVLLCLNQYFKGNSTLSLQTSVWYGPSIS